MNKDAISIQVYDKAARKSRSLSVYGASLDDVAKAVERAVAGRWKTTRLGDRRHRR